MSEQARNPEADPRLATILALAELEALARERMAAASFEYVAGGAWDELTLAENEAAWRRWRLRPRVLVDVSAVDPAVELLGQPLSMPVSIAPMAAQAMAHPDAEVAAACAAADAGVGYALSTNSSRSIEEVSASAPDAVLWFQLYTQADRGQTRQLVERAEAAGYKAIMLTVDLPVLGYRERERRAGFELPRPLGNLEEWMGADAAAIASVPGLDPAGGLTWHDIATIRSWSRLPLLLKGILTAEDGRLAVEHGVDGVIVSNHGARQLDRVNATADVLEEVVDAVAGRAEVWVDGGIRRGLDIAIAMALGADGVLVGRPCFWALAAGGEAGVRRMLEILRDEFVVALTLLGAPRPKDLGRTHVERAR